MFSLDKIDFITVKRCDASCVFLVFVWIDDIVISRLIYQNVHLRSEDTL